MKKKIVRVGKLSAYLHEDYHANEVNGSSLNLLKLSKAPEK